MKMKIEGDSLDPPCGPGEEVLFFGTAAVDSDGKDLAIAKYSRFVVVHANPRFYEYEVDHHGVRTWIDARLTVPAHVIDGLGSAPAIVNGMLGGKYDAAGIDAIYRTARDLIVDKAKETAEALEPGDKIVITNGVTPKKWVGTTGTFVRMVRGNKRLVMKLDKDGTELRVPLAVVDVVR